MNISKLLRKQAASYNGWKLIYKASDDLLINSLPDKYWISFHDK